MIKTANNLEQARMDAFVWCIPCLINNHRRQSTVQHVTEGGRRLGHMYTYGSCPWHHQAVTEHGMNNQQMSGMLGISFAQSRREFEAEYGDERDVLVPLQTWMLENNWEPYWRLHEKWQLLRSAN